MYKSIDDGYEAMFVQEVLAEHKSREMKEVIVTEDSYFAGKTINESRYTRKNRCYTGWNWRKWEI